MKEVYRSSGDDESESVDYDDPPAVLLRAMMEDENSCAGSKGKL